MAQPLADSPPVSSVSQVPDIIDQFRAQEVRVARTLDSYSPPDSEKGEERLKQVAFKVVQILKGAPAKFETAIGNGEELKSPFDIARAEISALLLEEYFAGVKITDVPGFVNLSLLGEIDKVQDPSRRAQYLRIHASLVQPAVVDALMSTQELIKSKLMSVFLHDIRSPQTFLQGYADILRDPRYGELSEKNQFFKNLFMAIDKLLLIGSLTPQVIGDLMSQKGAALELYDTSSEYRLGPVSNLENIITKISSGFDRRIQLTDPDGLVERMIPRDAMEFALLQLLSNAIKYSDPDKTIEISIVENKEHIAVVVTNTLSQEAKRKYKDIGTAGLLRQKPSEDIGKADSSSWQLGLNMASRYMELSGGAIVPVDDGNEPPDTLSMCIVFHNVTGS